ncbi:Ubiquitin-like-conjugating enzyme ATG10 [Coniochaeta hoffmannii]|uniref:Ubiquitin-like-conjugating enzyme ATG10 n=1 Tax=Coniochaeta hoffmannii TaxID=91930 RepID=A0AA38SBS9_9PEZI|nr:Ubiquitin-like-conjugating enzyme ATG10 [Coniochaeta hoffmannii]
MENIHKRSSEFENYPFLTADEFAEACHHLDKKYIQAELGPLRRQWKLRVNRALIMAFTPAAEYSTYIQIIRPLELDLDDGNLSAALDKLSFDVTNGVEGASIDADEQMREAEDQDDAALHKPPVPQRLAYVTYEIHLHPSYRSPCLWFTLNGLPPDEPAFNIDTVFRRLVPDQYKDGLRNAGPIGGISADHHPITGVPSFFVHPCLLGEAMSNFDCSKEDYLMVWLGLVGGCVGLWVPKEMALG